MIIKCEEMKVEQRTGERNGTLTRLIDNERLHNKTRLFARIVMKPGAKAPLHKHEGDCEVYYLLAGQARVNDNGNVKEVQAGDVIFTDNGESHSIENIGDTDLEYIAVILNL